jgi:hypothetical protein
LQIVQHGLLPRVRVGLPGLPLLLSLFEFLALSRELLSLLVDFGCSGRDLSFPFFGASAIAVEFFGDPLELIGERRLNTRYAILLRLQELLSPFALLLQRLREMLAPLKGLCCIGESVFHVG